MATDQLPPQGVTEVTAGWDTKDVSNSNVAPQYRTERWLAMMTIRLSLHG